MTETLSPSSVVLAAFPDAKKDEMRILEQIVVFKNDNRDVSSLLKDVRLKRFDPKKLQNFAATRY